jgi:Helix-hairpin-helix motif
MCLILTKPTIAITFSVFGLVFAASGQSADEAAGKTFERICSGCHDSSTATGERHTRREWQSMVGDMMSRGANGTEVEIREIVGWLTRHYGNLRVNQLSARDLEQEMELTSAEAESIVAYRTKNGRIADFDALKKTGVSASKLEPYKESVVY